MNLLNLYLISQTANGGYDTYDAAVVAAESEESARLIHPAANIYKQYPELKGIDNNWCKPDQVNVLCLGIADLSIKEEGVILSSYNAS